MNPSLKSPAGLKDAGSRAVAAAKTVNRFFPKRRGGCAEVAQTAFRSGSTQKRVDARRAPSLDEPHQAPLWGFIFRKEYIMTNNTQPVLIAYSVKDRGEGKQAIWTKIGACFAHGKGSGLTIQLDALPLGDRIVLREPKEDKVDGEKGGAQ
jgi:hypothetical protein